MSLITIITSIILASSVGIGGYITIKKLKSKPKPPNPPKSGKAVSLTIKVGKIQNKQ